jgi:hypothetical protein
MACGPDSRFSTLVIRHRIQSNSPRETLLTVVFSGLATIRREFDNRPLSGSMSALVCSQQLSQKPVVRKVQLLVQVAKLRDRGEFHTRSVNPGTLAVPLSLSDGSGWLSSGEYASHRRKVSMDACNYGSSFNASNRGLAWAPESGSRNAASLDQLSGSWELNDVK